MLTAPKLLLKVNATMIFEVSGITKLSKSKARCKLPFLLKDRDELSLPLYVGLHIKFEENSQSNAEEINRNVSGKISISIHTS
jgi:hypothetical protein